MMYAKGEGGGSGVVMVSVMTLSGWDVRTDGCFQAGVKKPYGLCVGAKYQC